MSRTETPVWQHYASAIVSGFVGDWLEARNNPLAMPMTLLHQGVPLEPEAPALEEATPVICLSMHGLMELESVFTFPGQPGRHYGAVLAEQIEGGATPLKLRYNTGRAIYRNGEALADLLETLVANWPVPVERIILMGHSMGGLLIRSACYYGAARQQSWLKHLESCVYIGSPHDGSWLARGATAAANSIQKVPRDYLKVVGEVIDLRSEGIRNLNRGDVLEEGTEEPPLLPGVRHFVVCGLLTRSRSNPVNALFGDALVQESSAQGQERSGWNLAGMTTFPGIDHIRLAHHPKVSEQLVEWLA